MACELEWLVSTKASALYIADALVAGRTLLDAALAAALEGPVDDLTGALASAGIPADKFFEQAIPSAVRFGACDTLAEVAVTKVVGPVNAAAAKSAVAMQLIALEQAFLDAAPGALEELELRGLPLGEQWEARGSGLLAALGRHAESELIVEHASVVLVLPVLGGGGRSHASYNSVTLEAVLANPVAELPEVVRLGWLLSQLTFDMPRFEDRLPREQLQRVGPLAMIPPTLAAAEDVELARLDQRTIETALATWTDSDIDPATLLDWWQTYRDTRPDWVVATGALAEMLNPEPGGESVAQN